MVRWSIGPLVHWSTGPLVRWSIGPLVECRMLNVIKVKLCRSVPPEFLRLFLFSAEKSSLHYTAQLEILFTQPIVTVCVTVVLQLIATTVSLQLKAMHANHAT